ncbi:hypothetical protein AGLY_012982 [Aphis glycines]|uniref:Uncharacterized protein n=1 Tax=Aphis glycines TaxID=307491 RepID=A0A6G0T7E5_APHGL|nr:hypothetical protein AGLY_012982 [Aphis glycines]
MVPTKHPPFCSLNKRKLYYTDVEEFILHRQLDLAPIVNDSEQSDEHSERSYECIDFTIMCRLKIKFLRNMSKSRTFARLKIQQKTHVSNSIKNYFKFISSICFKIVYSQLIRKVGSLYGYKEVSSSRLGLVGFFLWKSLKRERTGNQTAVVERNTFMGLFGCLRVLCINPTAINV